ncbi:helix-turn-helix transcriptional regulator [Kitasatospora sp. NBC_01287]|uniref:helix-turn-helix transcriptional regulator n=1 Tax=Kitasatospora sp. NBC_01287 TaxID=2903573 RepID=UPI002259DFEA|nr:helix-turn-helix transcriptional regulator [Kitasatospora sp. NBC_01287]MCX4749059.1 helix-turn-helix transcriptional regulator [Kitasatospora sp. NBC_01287]
MSRRARVTPAEAGLPDGGGRRRTPGLRREEVAVLAGVGVSWYQWLEQGREITVSPQVLDAVSRVLRLDEAERRHLYLLAGLNPPLPAAVQAPVSDGLRRLIEAWMPFPAHVLDPYWNTVAFNDAAGMVFGYGEADTNCLVSYFMSPIYRERDANWHRNAAAVVGQFRVAASERPGDPGYQLIVDDLMAQSTEFREIWERNDVHAAGQLGKVVNHPTAGQLHFESTQLRVPARSDLTIVLHTPLPDTGTAEQLEWLATPEGRRTTIRPAV